MTIIKNLMIDLPYLFGGEEVFKKAYVDGLNEESKNALDNLSVYMSFCVCTVLKVRFY